VNSFAGAPQTVYSDHFLHTEAIDGPIGYKLEVPPLHPLLLATTKAGFGADHAHDMAQFPTSKLRWRCCAMASTPMRRAAASSSAAMVRPRSIIRSAISSGMVRGAPC
jgi:hypothetical protein